MGGEEDVSEETPKRRKNRARKPINIIFHDGFAYISQKIVGDPPIRYLKCSMRNLSGCKATGKIPLDGTSSDFIQIRNKHNHLRNEDMKLKSEFMALLKEMCISQSCAVKKIYSAAKSCDPEGATIVPFETVQSSMRKWQADAQIFY